MAQELLVAGVSKSFGKTRVLERVGCRIAAGEFEPVDPRETAQLIKRSMIAFTHPTLIADCVEEHQDLEAAVRQSVRFLLRAITPRT